MGTFTYFSTSKPQFPHLCTGDSVTGRTLRIAQQMTVNITEGGSPALPSSTGVTAESVQGNSTHTSLPAPTFPPPVRATRPGPPSAVSVLVLSSVHLQLPVINRNRMFRKKLRRQESGVSREKQARLCQWRRDSTSARPSRLWGSRGAPSARGRMREECPAIWGPAGPVSLRGPQPPPE